MKRRRFPTIGLDIGSTSVKTVLVKPQVGRSKLNAARAIPLALPADSGQRAEAVRQALRGFPLEEADVVVGIGGAGTVLRALSLPKMSLQELKGALNYEAEKYIPFKLEEVFLDFAITGQGTAGQMEVMLAVARKEVVQEQLEILSAAGTGAAAVDLETLALANAWESVFSPGAPSAPEADAAALLYVGARKTIAGFFLNSRLQFAREIPLAGDAFTQAIAGALQLDVLEAERIKCDPRDRLEKIREAARSSWEEWLGECRRSFDFYENQYGHRVGRLVLSGGSAQFSGFREWVQEATSLPTEEWNPVASGPKPEGGQPIGAGGLALGVAFGLAIRGGERCR